MNRFEPYLPALKKVLQETDNWRETYGLDTNSDVKKLDEIEKILSELSEKLTGNYPFHHPQYAGQMLKPPHPIAWLAYSLAMTINPNNHALDGGPPTSEMEKEVVLDLAKMVGFGENSLGHLTSGGTVANLEALYIAREIHPGKIIAASSGAHYTHSRMCKVLNTPFLEIPADHQGVADADFLNRHADEIGTLVVTMGTTGLGDVEPLADLVDWAGQNNVRIHVDAAYGGFFTLIADQLESKRHWHSIRHADSIVIDPHKHGLQPYGCGSVLFKDPAVGRFYKHDSPYTYFTSDDLHLGEITLECSRAGATAAALWATLQLLPLTESGLGSLLKNTIDAAQHFADGLKKSEHYRLYREPALDIVAYFPKLESSNISSISAASRKIFRAGMEDKETGFHLSLFTVNASDFIQHFPTFEPDEESVVILRSVLMKPEHLEFIPELLSRLEDKAASVL